MLGKINFCLGSARYMYGPGVARSIQSCGSGWQLEVIAVSIRLGAMHDRPDPDAVGSKASRAWRRARARPQRTTYPRITRHTPLLRQGT
eukprot:1249842-Pleurochrysis_carterae.AAC.1